MHEARKHIYTARRAVESSLMAKGIFKGAVSDSQQALSGDVPDAKFVVSLGDQP